MATSPAYTPDALIAAAERGDTIVAIDGKPVRDPDDVATAIASRKVGDEIRVTVRRNGSEMTLTVRLERRPERAP